MRWLLVVAIASCAPTVDGPIEQQRARDAADAAQLAAQVAALPGVVTARASLARPAHDPFAPSPPARGAIVLVVDDAADRPRLRADALVLAHAAAPELAAPEVVIEVGAHRAALASVGPFTVEASSKPLLKLVLSLLLAAICAGSAYAAIRLRG